MTEDIGSWTGNTEVTVFLLMSGFSQMVKLRVDKRVWESKHRVLEVSYLSGKREKWGSGGRTGLIKVGKIKASLYMSERKETADDFPSDVFERMRVTELQGPSWRSPRSTGLLAALVHTLVWGSLLRMISRTPRNSVISLGWKYPFCLRDEYCQTSVERSWDGQCHSHAGDSAAGSKSSSFACPLLGEASPASLSL